MDYCFKLALAAGFVALPISLFAAEKSAPKSDKRAAGQTVKPLSSRQQWEKKLQEIRLAEQKRKEHLQEMETKFQHHQEELQSKWAQWNEPKETPPAGIKAQELKQQKSAGEIPKGMSQNKSEKSAKSPQGSKGKEKASVGNAGHK
jgi:hypothetical protein